MSMVGSSKGKQKSRVCIPEKLDVYESGINRNV